MPSVVRTVTERNPGLQRVGGGPKPSLGPEGQVEVSQELGMLGRWGVQPGKGTEVGRAGSQCCRGKPSANVTSFSSQKLFPGPAGATETWWLEVLEDP